MRSRLLGLLACAGLACGAESSRASGWSAPVEIDGSGAAALATRVGLGVDDAGNAFAAWSRRGHPQVVAARFDAAKRAWESPATLADVVDDAAEADQLDLAVAPSGGAVVVWRQGSAGLASVWSSWIDARTGAWHEATLVERDDTGDAAEPCVAALPAGGAVAVWHQWDGLRESLWANQLGDTPLRWTGRALLETTDSADATEPDVATDPHGNALAVWTQRDETSVTVWAARRDAGLGAWSAPFMLSARGDYDPDATPAPRVALDAAGNGLALWTSSTGRAADVPAASRVWASRYDAEADAWSVATPIDAGTSGQSTDAVLAVDATGDGFAAWRRRDETGAAPWVNVFASSRGAWQGATRLDGDDAGPPSLAAAGEARAVVIWQTRGRAALRTSRFDARAGGWSVPAPLATVDDASGPPRIVVDPAGRSVAVFPRAQPGGDGFGVWSVHAAAP